MKKVFVTITCILTFTIATIQIANAARGFSCPGPNQVNCVPANSTIGAWRANGGQMTGNTFAPNNQCLNIAHLPNNHSRLVCCYTKCGVFLLDVPYTKCTKISQARFVCDY